MQRSQFPSSRERYSFLHYQQEANPRERSSLPRHKPGPTAIEYAYIATLICIVAIAALHAIGIIR